MVITLLVFCVSLGASAQSASVNDRTPEQEAALQTEKLQKELNLTPEQAKSIYEINLKYARERRQSNKRADAVNLIGKKNEEINRVLNDKQHSELQLRKRNIQSDGSNNETYNQRADSKTRVVNNPVRRNTSGAPNTDRPVRTDFRTATRPASSTGRTTQTTNKPVRRNVSSVNPTQPGVRTERGNTSSSGSLPTTTAKPMQGNSTPATIESRSPSRVEQSQSRSSAPTRNEGSSRQNQTSDRKTNSNSRR